MVSKDYQPNHPNIAELIYFTGFNTQRGCNSLKSDLQDSLVTAIDSISQSLHLIGRLEAELAESDTRSVLQQLVSSLTETEDLLEATTSECNSK